MLSVSGTTVLPIHVHIIISTFGRLFSKLYLSFCFFSFCYTSKKTYVRGRRTMRENMSTEAGWISSTPNAEVTVIETWACPYFSTQTPWACLHSTIFLAIIWFQKGKTFLHIPENNVQQLFSVHAHHKIALFADASSNDGVRKTSPKQWRCGV